MTERRKIIFIINPISGTVKKSGVVKIIKTVLDKEVYDDSIVETM